MVAKSVSKESKKQEIRYRRWCLTIWQNDELFPTKEAVAKFICDKHEVKYLIIGDERTKKNDKPHFQAYVEYKNGRSFNSIKKQFPNLAHFEEARGTAQQSNNYCSKEDKNPLIIGYCNVSEPTLSKGDIAANLIDLMVAFELDNCPPLYELIRDYPELSDYIIKNYHTLEKIYNDIKKDKYKFANKPMQYCMGVEVQENGLPF